MFSIISHLFIIHHFWTIFQRHYLIISKFYQRDKLYKHQEAAILTHSYILL